MNELSFLGSHGNLISVTVCGVGRTLILLHGFPLDARMWHAQMLSLSETYQVIAPNFRGFRQSTLTDVNYSLADLADDIEQVRTHFAAERPITLCGLSMGGYVAFEYWRRHGRHLEALILAHTKPNSDTDEARAGRQEMANQAIAVGSWKAVAGMLEKLLPESLIQNRTQVVLDVEAMMQGCSPQTVRAAQHAMAARADFVAALPTLALPTLVITGELDAIAPPDATRKWAAVLPNSECVVVPGVAHLSPLEAPAAFNAHIVRFLQNAD